MEKTKVTKREYFEALKAAVGEMDKVGDYFVEDVVSFLDKQIQQLDAKAEKMRLKAADKKAEGDELREIVFSLLTDELQTGDQITAQVDGPDITKAKITSRLSQLVKLGKAEKEQIKTDSGKKMAYRLA